jgi:hypothetical protein
MSAADQVEIARRRAQNAIADANRINGRLQRAIGATEAGLKAVRAGRSNGVDALLDVLAELTRKDAA